MQPTGLRLTQAQTKSLYALRYVQKFHESSKFLEELKLADSLWLSLASKERIYGKPIDEYKGCTAAKAMQV